MEMIIKVLDEKRKGSFKVFSDNKENPNYDILELHSKNMLNSKKISDPFSAFVDIVGEQEKNIDNVKINYQLLQGNNPSSIELTKKINNIYDDFQKHIENLSEKTEKTLGIEYKLKKEDNAIAVLQMFGDYEIDKKIITKEDDINRELYSFQISKEGIGKKIEEKANKELNYIKEVIGGDEKNELFRVRSTYLPKTNTTVYMIDEKRFDLNDINDKNKAKPYWITKKVLTDKELLEELSQIKTKEKENKLNEKMELNKNITEKEIGTILNFVQDDKVMALLKDERYFKLSKENGKENIVDFDSDLQKNNWKKTAVLGAIMIVDAFAKNNLKNEKGQYSYDEKSLENTKYLNRAVNVVKDFQKSGMSLEEFIENPKFSQIGAVSALSLAEIDKFEKDKAINIDENYLKQYKDEGTYLDKVKFFADGALNEEGEKTDHIKGLNITEVLIDLNDGNTSEEQRLMLELQLLELTKLEEEKKKEQEKALKEALEEQEKFNKILIAGITGGIFAGLMLKSEKDEKSIEDEREEKSRAFNAIFIDILNNEKGFLPKSLVDFFDPEFLEEEYQKQIPEREVTEDMIYKFIKDEKYLINNLELSKTKNGIELINHSDKSTKEIVNNFDGSEEPKGIAEIMKAMAIANQNKIEFDNSKRDAMLLNIEPSGDVYAEYTIMANSPEKIYLEGMAKITSEKDKGNNIYNKIIEKENLTEKNDGATKVEKEISKKTVEEKLIKVEPKEISKQLDETFKNLKQSQLAKEIQKQKVYNELEKIERNENGLPEKKEDMEKKRYTDEDFQKDRYDALNKKKEEKDKDKDDGMEF